MLLIKIHMFSGVFYITRRLILLTTYLLNNMNGFIDNIFCFYIFRTRKNADKINIMHIYYTLDI